MPDLNRREFLSTVAAGVATTGVGAEAEARAASQGRRAAPPSAGLAAPAFRPLPLGAIRPAGWLQRQLRLQADGLSGHLDEFWPDVSQSQWFGGKAEGWERAPYWLDGAIPARVDPGRCAAPGPHRALRRLHPLAPARRRLVRPVPGGRRGEAVRHVGHPARQQGARAVSRGDGRRARARGGDEEPARAARRPRPHAALRLGQVPLVRGARARVLRVRADSREGLAARPCEETASPGRRFRGALPDG